VSEILELGRAIRVGAFRQHGKPAVQDLDGSRGPNGWTQSRAAVWPTGSATPLPNRLIRSNSRALCSTFRFDPQVTRSSDRRMMQLSRIGACRGNQSVNFAGKLSRIGLFHKCSTRNIGRASCPRRHGRRSRRGSPPCPGT
jgi:hypothetical protein